MTREELKAEVMRWTPALLGMGKECTDRTLEAQKAIVDMLEHQPQGDLISREAVLKEMDERHKNGDAITKGFIKNLPPIEPQEWISVKDRLPVCEEKVLVQAIRTFKGGDTITIVTTGMYEDGTISECDSRWYWEDVDYEKWDDENDCMIIPRGWWEDKAYAPDGVNNYQIDDKVVAWMPLPSPYKGE